MVVTDGEAEITEPVLELIPELGDHKNVFPPLAESVMEVPKQIYCLDAVPEIIGNGLTVTVMLVFLEHIPSLPVMVYVVVLVPEKITTAPVVVFNPVAGFHT